MANFSYYRDIISPCISTYIRLPFTCLSNANLSEAAGMCRRSNKLLFATFLIAEVGALVCPEKTAKLRAGLLPAQILIHYFFLQDDAHELLYVRENWQKDEMSKCICSLCYGLDGALGLGLLAQKTGLFKMSAVGELLSYVPGVGRLTTMGLDRFFLALSAVGHVFNIIDVCNEVAVKKRKKETALFTFSGRISVRREAPGGAAGDEGIASAIAEEPDASDGRLAADRKLTEKVNKAKETYEINLAEKGRVICSSTVLITKISVIAGAYLGWIPVPTTLEIFGLSRTIGFFVRVYGFAQPALV